MSHEPSIIEEESNMGFSMNNTKRNGSQIAKEGCESVAHGDADIDYISQNTTKE
ncbi:predicted protein [Pyrenophora tritici-repentis Pt-1C-BFP]|uniref:Uncharacterized protein n=1 Tax=Pyrenophora tritici-repentis (strain Pt-1C-BFP) TaxID=426418 RepID=B2VUS8_PYRTR|nr:uncharacterized protein PTRG_01065 [Pyrenophora tritici-repentis Pt-1C-BFP]EDU40503.1 predicted protein [Pyrenophora tritici-repentis Pt-1C-BFP]